MAQRQPDIKSTIDEADLTWGKFIERGGSGDVYRATWKSKSRGDFDVAAKKIARREGQSIEDLLGNEIFYLQKLDHPNIIKYYGHVINEDYVVIITEYAAKGSLYDYLKDKTSLPSELKLKWARQASRGIKYLQENNILHRDIKSPNFLITADDNLKICYFGIARDLTSTKTATSDKGTPRWLAPQIFMEQKLFLKADIFAFGIVLWELEACEIPYKDVWSQRIQWVVGKGERPEIPVTCPAFLRDLMQQCWDGDRNKRPTVDEIIQQLESGLQWRYKRTIDSPDVYVKACVWISRNNLALCMSERVEVYEVNEVSSHLAYTLRSAEWERKAVRDVAVSEALPDSILVICAARSYVYQCPAYETGREMKKYKIQSTESNDPNCMTANDSIVVVNMARVDSFIVCNLPGLTNQYHVYITFSPNELSIISTEYLVVMGNLEMVVKPVSDLSRTVCAIRSPSGRLFESVSSRNNVRIMYVACNDFNEKCRVYKYTWDGSGEPSYVNAGCVIDELRARPWHMSLSLSSGGLMAVRVSDGHTRIYSLE